MNPIAEAIEPMKSDAINRARCEAEGVIERIANELKENDNNIDKAAPNPSMYMSHKNYIMAKNKRNLFFMLASQPKELSFKDRSTYEMNQKKMERFIEMAEQDAATQYDVFVAKMIGKIGSVVSASIDGNHVWGYSILTVVKSDGSVERWKTQMIVNVSKLGKLFNQFPSRKIK